ncbi:hypothetical protein EDB89DRAFT_2226105 [Lactarius sanguifluus]|nr:hypothetical protein EDB89DRAFT_2226105 [Lactarius sanguifluus]
MSPVTGSSPHWIVHTIALFTLDHLNVATGHYPYEPEFQGQQVSTPSRKILHSIFYREPEVYRGRNILVVGGGGSGKDIALNALRRLAFHSPRTCVLRPLFRHVLSLTPTHASPALAFIGLPTFVGNGISDYAQALLDNLARIWHRVARPGGGAAYQDELVAILQDRGREGGGVPPRGTRFTEHWREFVTRETTRLRRAWFEIEAHGEDQVRKWLDTVKRGDEAEWAELMVRLVECYEDQGSQGGTCSGERDG